MRSATRRRGCDLTLLLVAVGMKCALCAVPREVCSNHPVPFKPHATQKAADKISSSRHHRDRRCCRGRRSRSRRRRGARLGHRAAVGGELRGGSSGGHAVEDPPEHRLVRRKLHTHKMIPPRESGRKRRWPGKRWSKEWQGGSVRRGRCRPPSCRASPPYRPPTPPPTPACARRPPPGGCASWPWTCRGRRGCRGLSRERPRVALPGRSPPAATATGSTAGQCCCAQSVCQACQVCNGSTTYARNGCAGIELGRTERNSDLSQHMESSFHWRQSATKEV